MTTSTPDYTMGYDEVYVDFMRSTEMQQSSRYLLPHLRSGLRFLDVGCGPGSKSVELAKVVAPGEFHGVDIEPSQIALAEELSRKQGASNATFQVADVQDLPFEDGYFDVVHFNDVLAFVPDTAGALTEAKRVLKQGGIIGCREMMASSCFAYPDDGTMSRAWEVFADLLAADDGHPDMGKELISHLRQVGFHDIRMAATFETYSDPAGVEILYELTTSWFFAPHVAEAVLKYSAATVRLLDDIRKAVEEWKASPDAFAGISFGEAIAVKS